MRRRDIEAFHDNGCQELVICGGCQPKQQSECHRLDNALFHHWKERIRNGEQITNMNVVTRTQSCLSDVQQHRCDCSKPMVKYTTSTWSLHLIDAGIGLQTMEISSCLSTSFIERVHYQL